MKKITMLVALTLCSLVMAQEKSKWTLGFGANAIDNSASKDGIYFQTKNWNTVPVFSKFLVEYQAVDHLSVSAEVAINRFSAKKEHNGTQLLGNDANFVGVDVNAKYNVDHFFTETKWFDASIIGGFGSFWVDGQANQSFNPGIALDFWLGDAYGFRVQTLGRVAFDNNMLGNNHLQHSIEFIFKI
jgi:hypothetical protein